MRPMVSCIKFLSFQVLPLSLPLPSFLPESLSFSLFFFLSLPLFLIPQRNTSGPISMLLLSWDLRTWSDEAHARVSAPPSAAPQSRGEAEKLADTDNLETGL